MITLDDLRKICPHTKALRLDLFVEPLNAAMAEFDVDNVAREAAFLAQIAHESMGFQRTREIWGPTAAQQKYEGRTDLGNTVAGDGHRFMGRGLLQITGRANYAACGVALGIPLLEQPSALEEPLPASRSAAWFWKSRGLNELADDGDFRLITKRINGGFNGWLDRVTYHDRAQQALA